VWCPAPRRNGQRTRPGGRTVRSWVRGCVWWRPDRDGHLGSKGRIDGDAVRQRQVAGLPAPGWPSQRLVENSVVPPAAIHDSQASPVAGAEGLLRHRVRSEIAHLAGVAWPVGGSRFGAIDLEAASPTQTSLVPGHRVRRGRPVVAPGGCFIAGQVVGLRQEGRPRSSPPPSTQPTIVGQQAARMQHQSAHPRLRGDCNRYRLPRPAVEAIGRTVISGLASNSASSCGHAGSRVVARSSVRIRVRGHRPDRRVFGRSARPRRWRLGGCVT
jgi:hypothetical protein